MSNMVDCDCVLMEKEIVGIRMTLYQCPACFRTISKPNEVKKQVKKNMKTYTGYVINAMNMGIRRPGEGIILHPPTCECIGGICTCSIPATSEVDEAEEAEEEAEHLINVPGPILPCQISNDEEAELLMSAPGPRHRQIFDEEEGHNIDRGTTMVNGCAVPDVRRREEESDVWNLSETKDEQSEPEEIEWPHNTTVKVVSDLLKQAFAKSFGDWAINIPSIYSMFDNSQSTSEEEYNSTITGKTSFTSQEEELVVLNMDIRRHIDTI